MTAVSAEQKIRTFEEAQAVLAANLPGYTRRPHQMNLAAQIEQAIADEVPGLYQAGCGTGKSLAALIPAILSGKRTVVATATLALMTQYRETDLPFLQEYLGVPFKWALLKGRSNYVCTAKVRELANPTAAQRDVIRVAEEALKSTTEIVDKDSLPTLQDREWNSLSMSAAECPGASSCPFAKRGECFAERAKAEAATAQVVITNVAYLVRDLNLRLTTDSAVQLLGDFRQLIIDEAHNLQDILTSQLADTIHERSLGKLARDLEGFFAYHDRDEALATQVAEATEQLWWALDRFYAEQDRRGGFKHDPVQLPHTTIIKGLGAEFQGLYRAIENARDEVKNTRVAVEGDQLARWRLMRRTEDWLARVYAITTRPADDLVRWVEQATDDRGTRRVLCSAPVEVGGFLRATLWGKVPAVLMSATLANGSDFSYLASQLGLDPGEALTYDAGTPFDYAKQARLYVPDVNHIPAPKGRDIPAWQAGAQEATRILVKASGGGALLLFTARKNMNEAYRALARQFEAAGLTVLRQGDDSTKNLLARFKQGGAVLFGLRTWFEGVDVPGDALRLVVIDKLPFAPPTDIIINARDAAYERKHGPKSSFNGNRNCKICNDNHTTCNGRTIPSMQLVLNQAFGRLIRHRDDKGVVAILDSRLTSTGWGKKIKSALPPAPVTEDIHEAADFLAR